MPIGKTTTNKTIYATMRPLQAFPPVQHIHFGTRPTNSSMKDNPNNLYRPTISSMYCDREFFLSKEPVEQEILNRSVPFKCPEMKMKIGPYEIVSLMTLAQTFLV